MRPTRSAHGRVASHPHPQDTPLNDAGCSRGEFRGRSALLDDLKTAHRINQVVQARRSDKTDIGCLAAQETRHIDKESPAPPVLEVGIEDWFTQSGDGLDNLVPAVHLVDQITVDMR